MKNNSYQTNIHANNTPTQKNSSNGAKNLSDLVNKIKTNLASEIETMAERIIQERKNT